MISIDPELVSCGDAAEGAALGLLGLMTGISEEYWCAGWMSGLEHSLWLASPGTAYGQGIITERQATLLRLLSDECNGWWIWHDAKGPLFVTMEDWLEEIARHEERKP